eukprot:symbB.v1.2.025929.t1/scaffold2553.1/size78617/3
MMLRLSLTSQFSPLARTAKWRKTFSLKADPIECDQAESLEATMTYQGNQALAWILSRPATDRKAGPLKPPCKCDANKNRRMPMAPAANVAVPT